jgi:three-Cys-motif partner protein
MITLADYAGREQSYVKHVLLESYLEKLVHKIASRYDHVAYVDGFAGPWLSASEKFEDTSFGIALNALRSAKATWKQYGRDVKMSAFLVERDKTAHSRLAQVPARYPDVMIKTHCADFLNVVPTILGEIAPNAFTFFLIDPKGWRVPLKTLAPLLSRPNSEVIFNFMFDFINRAASINEPKVVAGLDELIPLGNWRAALAEGERNGGLSPEERNEILVNAFSDNLRDRRTTPHKRSPLVFPAVLHAQQNGHRGVPGLPDRGSRRAVAYARGRQDRARGDDQRPRRDFSVSPRNGAG